MTEEMTICGKEEYTNKSLPLLLHQVSTHHPICLALFAHIPHVWVVIYKCVICIWYILRLFFSSYFVWWFLLYIRTIPHILKEFLKTKTWYYVPNLYQTKWQHPDTIMILRKKCKLFKKENLRKKFMWSLSQYTDIV